MPCSMSAFSVSFRVSFSIAFRPSLSLCLVSVSVCPCHCLSPCLSDPGLNLLRLSLCPSLPLTLSASPTLILHVCTGVCVCACFCVCVCVCVSTFISLFLSLCIYLALALPLTGSPLLIICFSMWHHSSKKDCTKLTRLICLRWPHEYTPEIPKPVPWGKTKTMHKKIGKSLEFNHLFNLGHFPWHAWLQFVTSWSHVADILLAKNPVTTRELEFTWEST